MNIHLFKNEYGIIQISKMFLEEFFIRGMSLPDATGMVIDMLMAGIDTVLLEINSSPKSQLIK